MADQTPIEWADATWNIITGCSVVSPGCTNCYAMKLAGTRLQHHPSRAGLTVASKAGPVWNGQVRFNAEWLTQPLRWTRPRMIFVCAHGDLFHEGVPDEWLDQIFAVMALCPQHTFQVLTKRPERMRAYLGSDQLAGRLARAIDRQQLSKYGPYTREDVVRCEHLAGGPVTFAWGGGQSGTTPDYVRPWPLPNVWLGVSVEDQTRADERIPVLLDTPAAVRWISAEPLLGPVDLENIDEATSDGWNVLRAHTAAEQAEQYGEDVAICHDTPRLDWVVAGGESGPGARPMHPDWARQLRDQCAEAGVPFLFKQWGEWAPASQYPANGRLRYPWPDGTFGDVPLQGPNPYMASVGKKAAGRRIDGQLHDGFPAVRS